MNTPDTITTCCWIHPGRESSADFEAVCPECEAAAWAWARAVGLAGHSGWLHAWLRDVAGVVQAPAIATPDEEKA
jgi:hypothetical protein